MQELIWTLGTSRAKMEVLEQNLGNRIQARKWEWQHSF